LRRPAGLEETKVTVPEVHGTVDRKKLYQLASHPGTFPEMIESTYLTGREEGKDEAKKQAEEATAARLGRVKRQIALVAASISVLWLACVLFDCFGLFS
jgi:hypothetical protein